jgi:hypothetical protein
MIPARRDRAEALGVDERARVAERPADVGQAPVAGEDLGRRGRRAGGVDDAAAGEVVRVDPLLAPDHDLRLVVAVGRGTVEVHVAGVLGGEEQRVLVLPDRLAEIGEGPALAVERLRQDPPPPAGRLEHADLAVPGQVPPAGRVAAGDPGALRRPRRVLVLRVGPGQGDGLAARCGHDEQVDEGLDVPVVVTGGGEGDVPAVGRPRRLPRLEVAARQLHGRPGAVGGDDEDLAAAVDRPPDVVELELEPREPPRRPPSLVLLLVGGVGDARREDDPRAVPRPAGLRDVLFEIGQTLRLAPADGQDVELLRGAAVAVRREREARAVRRPARVGVHALAGREAARRLRPVGRDEPDRPAVLVRLAVDAAADEGDRQPVRRHPRIGRPSQLVEILRPHGAERISD